MAAGIGGTGWSYGQPIVTTISHERPHEGVAAEHSCRPAHPPSCATELSPPSVDGESLRRAATGCGPG